MPSNKIFKRYIFLGLFLFTILPACLIPLNKTQTAANSIDGKETIPSNEKEELFFQEEINRFEDVPIPGGFKMDRKESFIYETPALKAGKLVYKGSENIMDVISFFKNEMPGHGWKLVNIFEDEVSMLNFSKPGWICYMRVYKGTWNTTIEIKVGPTTN